MSNERADLEELALAVKVLEEEEEHQAAQCVKDAIAELKVLRMVVSYKPCAECQTQPSDRKCQCAAIQSADPRRHFRGCPERKPLEDQPS